jgi:hypothetical protein
MTVRTPLVPGPVIRGPPGGRPPATCLGGVEDGARLVHERWIR